MPPNTLANRRVNPALAEQQPLLNYLWGCSAVTGMTGILWMPGEASRSSANAREKTLEAAAVSSSSRIQREAN